MKITSYEVRMLDPFIQSRFFKEIYYNEILLHMNGRYCKTKGEDDYRFLSLSLSLSHTHPFELLPEILSVI